MSKILFVNACPRPESRTLELARAVLEKMDGQVQEVALFDDMPQPLTWDSLQLRERLCAAKDFSHPMLRYALDFSGADRIVVAAPYWDLLFPAVVRSYFESVTVNGLTFVYGPDGRPHGLCNAGQLIYVTTAGGPILQNLGFEYVAAISRAFFGIEDVRCVRAEGLDIHGADVAARMREAKNNIDL